MRPNRSAGNTAKKSGTRVSRVRPPALACFSGIALICLLFTASFLHAADVYRSVDAQGLVIFSDVQTSGAVVVQVDPAAPRTVQSREDTLAEQQRIIDQQLEVADSLEASRLAREAARTRRLEALAAVRPPVPAQIPAEPETRYVRSYSYQHLSRYPSWHPGYPSNPSYPSAPWRPGVPGHPGHPDQPGLPDHPAHPIAPPPPTSPTSFPVRFPYRDQ